MKKVLVTLAMLLSFGFTIPAVAAQTDGVEAPDMSMEIEGATSAYGRTYSVDFAALMSTPEAMDDPSVFMRNVSVQGIQFDSEDNASKYMDDSMTSLDEVMNSDDPVEGMEDVTVEDLDGFDKDGVIVLMDMPDLDAALVMIVFQDGDQIFQVSAMDGNLEDARAKAEAVTKFVIDAEIENDEVTFNEDGTSTGGVFDRMPVAGDEIVADLTTVTDLEILAPGAE